MQKDNPSKSNIENAPTFGFDDAPQLTTSWGMPVDDNQNSLTAGPRGPQLLQDVYFIDKHANFNRERIPERVVHAKGTSAHGYFEVTDDITEFCKANFLDTVGKKTPIFIRFSTVIGEKGSADTRRDPRGFAVKFYTEEGNWDMVGNNTPVFFVRDAMKFPDFIHSQKRNPQTNLFDKDNFWDFLSLTPESIHQVTILFSDRGTPDGFRHMHGFGSNTFKLVNKNGEAFFTKFHFLTDQGISNLSNEVAEKLMGADGDYSTRDLYSNIKQGKEAKWTFYVQVMPEKEAETYRWDINDVTKIWLHGDYPLRRVGKLTVNKMPDNFFNESEQAAFGVHSLVPGIEASNDKMLQGRLWAYQDTQRHRLGKNFNQLPINCPFRTRVANQFREGRFSITNPGSAPTYEPSSFGSAKENKKFAIKPIPLQGAADKYPFKHPNDDFAQPNALFSKVMKDKDRENLINNIVGHLKDAKKFIQERQCKIFYRVNPEYGMRVAKGLSLDVNFSSKF